MQLVHSNYDTNQFSDLTQIQYFKFIDYSKKININQTKVA